jgi:hypothetical protein
MTRAQLYSVIGASLASTAVVLGQAGSGGVSSAAVNEALVLAAKQRTAAAPAASTPAAASAPVPATAPPAIPAAAPTPAAAPAPAAAPTAGATPTPKPEPAHKQQPATARRTPSKIGHVFVIALSGAGVEQTFAAGSPAPYLATKLRPKGTLLDNYSPLGTADLPNYIALVSGQPPNVGTNAECPTYGAKGCSFPNTVLTLADEVTSAGGSWRAYAESMGNGTPPTQTCRHPDDGSADDTLHGRAADEYATRHNPFVYFHSLLDLGDCITNDVTLDKLDTDLGSARTTPTFSFIAPDLCDGGTETPCADGRPGGVPAADAFLQQWVPKIEASAAYRHDGVIMIAFVSAVPAAAGQPAPAAPPRTGVLLLSRFAKAGATVDTPYGPYDLLRSIEGLLALDPLGKAKGAASFVKSALPDALR